MPPKYVTKTTHKQALSPTPQKPSLLLYGVSNLTISVKIAYLKLSPSFLELYPLFPISKFIFLVALDNVFKYTTGVTFCFTCSGFLSIPDF